MIKLYNLPNYLVFGENKASNEAFVVLLGEKEITATVNNTEISATRISFQIESTNLLNINMISYTNSVIGKTLYYKVESFDISQFNTINYTARIDIYYSFMVNSFQETIPANDTRVTFFKRKMLNRFYGMSNEISREEKIIFNEVDYIGPQFSDLVKGLDPYYDTLFNVSNLVPTINFKKQFYLLNTDKDLNNLASKKTKINISTANSETTKTWNAPFNKFYSDILQNGGGVLPNFVYLYGLLKNNGNIYTSPKTLFENFETSKEFPINMFGMEDPLSWNSSSQEIIHEPVNSENLTYAYLSLDISPASVSDTSIPASNQLGINNYQNFTALLPLNYKRGEPTEFNINLQGLYNNWTGINLQYGVNFLYNYKDFANGASDIMTLPFPHQQLKPINSNLVQESSGMWIAQDWNTGIRNHPQLLLNQASFYIITAHYWNRTAAENNPFNNIFSSYNQLILNNEIIPFTNNYNYVNNGFANYSKNISVYALFFQSYINVSKDNIDTQIEPMLLNSEYFNIRMKIGQQETIITYDNYEPIGFVYSIADYNPSGGGQNLDVYEPWYNPLIWFQNMKIDSLLPSINITNLSFKTQTLQNLYMGRTMTENNEEVVYYPKLLPIPYVFNLETDLIFNIEWKEKLPSQTNNWTNFQANHHNQYNLGRNLAITNMAKTSSDIAFDTGQAAITGGDPLTDIFSNGLGKAAGMVHNAVNAGFDLADQAQNFAYSYGGGKKADMSREGNVKATGSLNPFLAKNTISFTEESLLPIAKHSIVRRYQIKGYGLFKFNKFKYWNNRINFNYVEIENFVGTVIEDNILIQEYSSAINKLADAGIRIWNQNSILGRDTINWSLMNSNYEIVNHKNVDYNQEVDFLNNELL